MNLEFEWLLHKVKASLQTLGDRQTVAIDCEHDSYDNMRRAVIWLEERGYRAEISLNAEILRISKR